jgi:hypothetical protein
MKTRKFGSRYALRASGFMALLGVLAVLVTLALAADSSQAGWFDSWFTGPKCESADCSGCSGSGCVIVNDCTGEIGGTWYWLRSPEEERRIIMGLFNRYCIRCHGVDGQGVWDIPGVPDFTNPRFHACRSDGQLARAILEGRGAVMPPFRGTLTLEEGWGMARYLRTFIPGTQISRPDAGSPAKGPVPMPRPDTVPGTVPGKKPSPDAGTPSKSAPSAADKKSGI